MKGSARTVCKMFELGLVTREEARVWLGVDKADRSVVERVSQIADRVVDQGNHAAWFDACCFRHSTLVTDRRVLVGSYLDWCKENDEVPAPKTHLMSYLRGLKLGERKSGSNRYFLGLGLKEEEGGNPQ